jgi:hypothetical protein
VTNADSRCIKQWRETGKGQGRYFRRQKNKKKVHCNTDVNLQPTHACVAFLCTASRVSKVGVKISDRKQERSDWASGLFIYRGTIMKSNNSTMGTGGKARPGRHTDHSPPSSAEIREWVGAIPPLPPSAYMACSGTALALFLVN